MKTPASSDTPGDEVRIRDAAMSWRVRQDRKLTRAEEREREAWLAADPRHAAALERASALWETMRKIGVRVRQEPAEVPARYGSRAVVATVALAAAIAVGVFFLQNERGRSREQIAAIEPGLSEPSPARTRMLSDGTKVDLRRGAEIMETFLPGERRVRLLQGEAYFRVSSDATRPFVVEVDGVRVRAVGTAFAVGFAADTVDVLVTEGTVLVSSPEAVKTQPKTTSARPADEMSTSAMVHAGHRAVVFRGQKPAAAGVVVSAVSPGQIQKELAWSESMLELGGATLGELAAHYTRSSGRRIEVEPELAAVRIGGRLPTGDVDGFIRALEEIYGVRAEHRSDGMTILRKAR